MKDVDMPTLNSVKSPTQVLVGSAQRLRGRAVKSLGIVTSWAQRARSRHNHYRPGTTVVIVNWNSARFLKLTLAAIEAKSPPDTKILVVDNASTDGSREYLASRTDIETIRLPYNMGHGIGLDLAIPRVSTEYVAVLDVDAFPVSDEWLHDSIAHLERGAKLAGARLHRNFVHPSFLVAKSKILHDYNLTFRPIGSLATMTTAPLFLDVGEAMSQRVLITFGGGSSLHFFEATSTRGPGLSGSVFGGIVYHNLYATQGKGYENAWQMFHEEFLHHHPNLAPR